MKKQLVALILGVAMIATITGCANTNKPKEDASSIPASTESVLFESDEKTDETSDVSQPEDSMASESTETEQEVQEDTSEAAVSDVRFIFHENGDGSGTVLEGYAGNDITEVVVPAEIDGNAFEIVGEGAFLGKKLVKADLPDGIQILGAGAFQDCEDLKEVNFGSGLTQVGDMSFANCKSLEKVTFPEGLEKIGTVAFMNNEALTEVHIPASVTECDNFADASTCKNLVVYTPSGSVAEKVANELGFKVINE